MTYDMTHAELLMQLLLNSEICSVNWRFNSNQDYRLHYKVWTLLLRLYFHTLRLDCIVIHLLTDWWYYCCIVYFSFSQVQRMEVFGRKSTTSASSFKPFGWFDFAHLTRYNGLVTRVMWLECCFFSWLSLSVFKIVCLWICSQVEPSCCVCAAAANESLFCVPQKALHHHRSSCSYSKWNSRRHLEWNGREATSRHTLPLDSRLKTEWLMTRYQYQSSLKQMTNDYMTI